VDLYFVTGNKGKVSEAEKILGFPIHIANIDLPEIQSLDLNEIVKDKVERAYEKINKPVFVDDVGMFVNAWNGFPGPFIKFMRLSGSYDNELLLKMLAGEKNRAVIVKAVVGFCDGDNIHLFEGKVEGVLADEERGSAGWGFDPIFIPHGYDQTFAEIGEEKKNKISHRAIAMNKFKEFITNF
jgi:XTP/dITP diphosphohydrolase